MWLDNVLRQDSDINDSLTPLRKWYVRGVFHKISLYAEGIAAKKLHHVGTK
jgi:hypothetical protein